MKITRKIDNSRAIAVLDDTEEWGKQDCKLDGSKGKTPPNGRHYRKVKADIMGSTHTITMWYKDEDKAEVKKAIKDSRTEYIVRVNDYYGPKQKRLEAFPTSLIPSGDTVAEDFSF